MNRTLDANEFHAQAVFNAIEGFINRFDDKGEITVVRDILQAENQDLKGGIVGQQPERFTEDQLILPTLQALGYDLDDITAQPADLVPDERKRPDFLIDDVHEACVCIVEAKRFGCLNRTASSANLAEEELHNTSPITC